MVVLISGTCKTEPVEDQKALISLVLEAWATSTYGESALGSVWSIATDGDARRRQAIHALCMVKTLSSISPIYPQLSNLPLFNLSCGMGDITHDGDFKHEEKRFASALRSNTGVFVNGTHISPSFIKSQLRAATSITDGCLDSLFKISDRQNVPKANSLLKGIYDACQERDTPFQTANRSFILLSKLLYAFYAPHTTPSMSLSQQMTHLSECAHILFVIFRVDGTSFISSQLYYDIQASIKNSFFCVAKTKVLNPDSPFYLLQTGDDCLENRFGIYRTASSDCNGDILQMAERSAAAQQIDHILAENPDYDRTPYRISLKGAESYSGSCGRSVGTGHAYPRVVQSAAVNGAYTESKTEKRESLRGLQPVATRASHEKRWGLYDSARGRDIDMMQPFGHYVGVTELVPEEVELTSSAPATSSSTTALNPPELHSSLLSGNSELFLGSTHPDTSLDFALAGSAGLGLGISDEAMSLEDLLPPYGLAETDNTPPLTGGLPKRGWVEVQGRWVHLASAARVILGIESNEKSTDRLRRVCGFTRYPSTFDQSDSILGDVCLVGQLILALVRVGDEITLVAVR
ncbi:hypothetical protein FRC06_010019, partial [Ceratobasidium sp. 370]